MSSSEMRSVTRRWVKGTMPVLRHNSRYVVYTSPVVSFGFPISSFNRIPRRMTFDCVGRLFTASITVSSSILFFARWTCSSVMCSSPWRSASSALTRRRSRARRASPCSWAASAAIRWSTPSSAVPFSNARRARSDRMSNNSSALYGGKTIFSSARRDRTRGSRYSVNLRSFEIPMIETRAFERSSLIFKSW